MEGRLITWIGIQCYEGNNTLNVDPQTQHNTYQIPAGIFFFTEIDKLFLKCTWKCKKPKVAETRAKLEGLHSHFQSLLESKYKRDDVMFDIRIDTLMNKKSKNRHELLKSVNFQIFYFRMILDLQDKNRRSIILRVCIYPSTCPAYN